MARVFPAAAALVVRFGAAAGAGASASPELSTIVSRTPTSWPYASFDLVVVVALDALLRLAVAAAAVGLGACVDRVEVATELSRDIECFCVSSDRSILAFFIYVQLEKWLLSLSAMLTALTKVVSSMSPSFKSDETWISRDPSTNLRC